MTTPEAVCHQPGSVPLPRRLVAYAVVGVARLLATRSPRQIRAVLGMLRRGARPATLREAKAARDTVVAVSLTCAAREGCLPRSLATVLLCRLQRQLADLVRRRPAAAAVRRARLGRGGRRRWWTRAIRRTTSAPWSGCRERDRAWPARRRTPRRRGPGAGAAAGRPSGCC